MSDFDPEVLEVLLSKEDLDLIEVQLAQDVDIESLINEKEEDSFSQEDLKLLSSESHEQKFDRNDDNELQSLLAESCISLTSVTEEKPYGDVDFARAKVFDNVSSIFFFTFE